MDREVYRRVVWSSRIEPNKIDGLACRTTPQSLVNLRRPIAYWYDVWYIVENDPASRP